MLARDPGANGHIFESPVAAIAEQTIGERRISFAEFRQLGAISEEDVHPAIAVIVQDADAAAHRLRKVLAAREIVIRDVGKP